ncbi:MAG: lipopolysaccharide heptosyltransferase II [Deltaproteobacteria bacterium]|nr:lipopolysaccharide heptosyltransferase II [Deltaproteobacteria bacterium]
MSSSHRHSQPRILLVKLSSFGDVLHALPFLEALRVAYPRAHITWLAEAAYAPLLAGHPALNEVWIAPRLRPAEFWSGANPAACRRLVQQLRARPFDLVVDVQGLLKSAVWVALAKSPRKVGYDRTRELSYLALTERVKPFDPEAHAVWRYLNLAQYLGAPPTLPRFRLGLGEAVDISALIPGKADRPLAVLHPGARWVSKLWPPASWASLSEWLHGQGFQVAVTGSAADRELAAGLVRQSQAPLLNLAGATSLAQLAAILRKTRLAVTTDTGAMHLAAALGTPVAALFGPTAPWRTGPFGSGHQVVRLGLSCSPCFKRQCLAPRCLTDLTPEMIEAACEKILSVRPIS